MTTPLLEIIEVANNQVNQYLTVNEAIRALESAGNDMSEVDLSAGNVTLTSALFVRSFLFKSTGNSVARNLTVPQKKRLFAVMNGGTGSLNVVRGSVSIAVSVGSLMMFYSDGTANGLFAIAGGGSSNSVAASASSSAGLLTLSSVTAGTITVTLTENISSIVLPPGASGQRKDLMIRFVQDATGGRTVSLSAFAWNGDGVPPAVASAANAVTYVSAVNVNNIGWEAFK